MLTETDIELKSMVDAMQRDAGRRKRREAERAAHIELEARRKFSGASPVEWRAFPLWFSKRMTAAIHSLPHKPHDLRCMSAWNKYQLLIGKTCDRYAFDHVGFVRVDGVWCFVMEPYSGGRDVQVAQEFAEMLGVNVQTNLPSWWNPPHTTRHLFTPKV